MSPVAWTPDGDDATVPAGAMAPASPRAVHGEPCERRGCFGRGQPHGAGFRHAYKEPKKKAGQPVKRHAAALKRAREGHARAVAAKPTTWPDGPGAGLRRQITPTGSPLLVLSAAPWAWTTDRRGRPVPLGT